jgi:hypothetical protein
MIEVEINGARLRIPPNASRDAIFAVVNGSLKLTHFRFDRRHQSDPPFCRSMPPGQAA